MSSLVYRMIKDGQQSLTFYLKYQSASTQWDVWTGIHLVSWFWPMMVILQMRWFTRAMKLIKVYVARVKGIANKENLRPLTRVTIDGKKTKPATYEILKVDVEKKTVQWFSWPFMKGVTTRLKKMFEAVGLLVDKLSGPSLGIWTSQDFVRVNTVAWTKKKEISQLHNQQWLNLKKHESNPNCAGQRLSKWISPYFRLLVAFNRPVPIIWSKRLNVLVWKVSWWGLQGFYVAILEPK